MSDLLILAELVLRLIHAVRKAFGRIDDDWPLDRYGRDVNRRAD